MPGIDVPETISCPKAPFWIALVSEWSTNQYPLPMASTLNSTIVEPPAGTSVVWTFVKAVLSDPSGCTVSKI